MADETPVTNLNDPMNLRNSDTGKMKRLEPNTPVSSQGRKTLKLKPIVHAEDGSVTTEDGTPVETSTVAINRKRSASVADAPTADIPMTAAAHPAAPSSSLPGANQTIKLRPSAPSTIAPKPVSMPGITDAAQGDNPKPASAQTIKLTPKSEPDTPTPTARLARSTIKLTPPSVATHVAGATPAPSSPTIKLQAPSSQPGGAAAASATTIKLQAPSAGPAPSSPTIKLQTPSAGGHAGTTMKIGIKHSESAQVVPNVPGAQGFVPPSPGAVGKKAASKEEPHVLFTVCSAVALVALICAGFIAFAQYSNFWNKADIDVPGLERLTKSK